jgi:hypothetical protein
VLRVHVNDESVQLHPVPLSAVAVNPLGSESVTVTTPLVVAVPPLETVMLYEAPFWPWLKFPLWDFVTRKSGAGAGAIVVTSVATLLVVFVSPPPVTVAELVTLDGALPATLTVSVSAGYVLPAASAVLRVHVSEESVQLQAEPLSAVAVNPAGRLSVTVTTPLVDAVPLLRTVSV